jgi:EmrB/QacA subfamily drug resistance transporter
MNHASQTPPRTWRILVATSISVVLVFVNQSGLTIALPSVSRDLDANGVETTWFLLSYMLVTTCLVLVFGRITDIVGRRRLYLLGIVVFLIGTLWCGFSTEPWMLLAARVTQGIGAASIVTNTTAILTDSFPSRSLGTALGINATVAAVGQTIGPLIGGAVTELFGWRWIFFGGVPVGLLALVWSYRLIPTIVHTARRERLDLVGTLLSIFAIGTLVLYLSYGPEIGWTNGVVLALGAGTLVLWFAFILSQRRIRHPLLDLSLFRDKFMTLGYLAALLNSTSNFAIVLLVSLYLQGIVGASPLDAGLMIAPSPFATMIAALIAGRLAHRVSTRILTTLGMSLVAGGGLLLTVTISAELHYAVFAAALALVGFGVGLFMTPNTTALMARAPRARRGIANALRTTVQNAGYLLSTALGLAIATAALDAEQRRAAYAGALRPEDAAIFLSGIQTSLLFLSVLALVGAAVCLVQPRAAPDLGRDS